ncbi:hypothetical protein [Photobacterium sp. OFAV2-7]|uniref:hypothetical protein n=1 Tax=Photobacterium sp. OFAV2-7 TaxID=2917748 RepID=UPI001EF45366|nr:hypothetical protein [Photobacterium sp. OFAV2-7]MCG7584688.1 hypothetical protein [Photobacterium sp. OFAV2-7]
MVSIETLDKNLIELKLALPKSVENIQLDCYLFIPKILDLNEYTYPSELFYRHLHNEQYLYTDGISLNNEALHLKVQQYGQQTYKSHRHYRRSICHIGDKVIRAMIADVDHVLNQQPNIKSLDLLITLLDNLDKICEGFRAQQPAKESLMHHFRYVDEYINWTAQQTLLRLMNRRKQLSKEGVARITAWIRKAEVYSVEQNYRLRSLQAPDQKQTHRLYLLKDYLSRYRLLDSKRRRKGVLIEQGVFSVAAFMSMAIATIIAFVTQQAFGNFSTPFFFALTFSYILKDRFKELSRNYIFRRIMARQCQFEYDITDPLDHKPLVTMKDGCCFISQSELPESVKNIIHRARRVNRNRREDVLHYKKHYNLNNKKIEHQYHGIKDKIVINIHKMLRNIPKESLTVYSLTSETSTKEQIDKNQIIYMVISIDDKHHKVLTLWVNSKGISSHSISDYATYKSINSTYEESANA